MPQLQDKVAIVTGAASGELLMTNDAADNATHNMQLLGEAVAFLRGDGNTLWELAPGDFQFDLQVLDLGRQFLLRGSGDQHEQGVVRVLHGW